MSSSNDRPALVAGIDVGGTKVLGLLVDAARPEQPLAQQRVPTPLGAAALVDVIAELVAELGVAHTTPAGVGVGLPGLVDHDGRLRIGPHLPGIVGFPFASTLEERLGVPVRADNDANCHALAEQRAGAARGADEALIITLGTGIGGGVITGGRLLEGHAGFAGEPGHMVVDPTGPPCPCGRRGCWEMFASGTGLSRLARDAALAGRIDAAVSLAGGDVEAVRGEHVTAAARAGDEGARAVLGELADWIAIGLGNLANLLDPAVIVLGGGLVDAADLLLEPIRTRFTTALMASAHRPEIPILPAALGDVAGAIGAALLCVE